MRRSNEILSPSLGCAQAVGVLCRHERERSLESKKCKRIRSTPEVILLVNLDGHELRDAPGISQRVDNVFGGEFAHGQCQVAFEGCLDRASIDPFDVFRRASTTNQLHQKFCVLHSLLCYLDGSLHR